MALADRCVRWAPEASYGVAVTPGFYLDIAGESLKPRMDLLNIRPRRSGSLTRQALMHRSVHGMLEPYLSYPQLSQVLGALCGSVTEVDLGGSVGQSTFLPSQAIPASWTVDVAREVELHRFTGVFFTAGRISFGLGDRHFGMQLECLGADEGPGGEIPSPDYTSFREPAHITDTGAPTCFQAVLSDGATTRAVPLESIDLQFVFNRSLRWPRRGLNPVGIVGGGAASGGGRFKWFYDEDTQFLLEAMRSRDPVSMTLTMQGASLGGGNYEGLEVHYPVTKLLGDPPTLRASGSKNIDFQVDQEAFLDPASGYPFRAQVIHATEA